MLLKALQLLLCWYVKQHSTPVLPRLMGSSVKLTTLRWPVPFFSSILLCLLSKMLLDQCLDQCLDFSFISTQLIRLTLSHHCFLQRIIVSLLKGSFFVLVALSDMVKLRFPRTLICLHIFFVLCQVKCFSQLSHCNWDARGFWHTASCKVFLTKFWKCCCEQSWKLRVGRG